MSNQERVVPNTMATSSFAYVWQYFDDVIRAISFRMLDPTTQQQGAPSLVFVATTALLVALVETPEIPTKDLWSYAFAHPRSYVLSALLFVGAHAAIIALACRRSPQLRPAVPKIASAYAYMYGALLLLKTAIYFCAAGAPRILARTVATLEPENEGIWVLALTLVSLVASVLVDSIAVAILLAGAALVIREARTTQQQSLRSAMRDNLIKCLFIVPAAASTMIVVGSFSVAIHPNNDRIAPVALPIDLLGRLNRALTQTQGSSDISLGASAGGRLAFGDEVVAGRYRDLWTLKGDPNSWRTVTVDLTSPNFDTYVQIFDTNRTLWPVSVDDDGGDLQNSRHTQELPKGDTLTIGVTSYSFGATGQYDLVVLPHIAVGDEVTGRIPAGGIAQWVLNATPATSVVAQVSAVDGAHPSFTPRIQLIGSGIGATDATEVVVGQIRATLQESLSYRVAIHDEEERAGGHYKLALRPSQDESRQPSEQTSDGASVHDLEVGESNPGRLEDNDARADGRFVDRWLFNVQEAQRLIAQVESLDFDTVLRLLAVDGSVLQENDDVDGRTGRSRLVATLPTGGQYTLVVTSFFEGEEGEYQVTVNELDETNLRMNEWQSEALADSDSYQDGKYVDVWRVSVSAGMSIIGEVRSNDFDTYLRLLRSNGESVEENDNVGNERGLSRVATISEEAGEYLLQVTSYWPNQVGNYEVLVTGLSVPTLSVGEAIEEALDDEDDSENEKYRDVWRLVGAAARREIVAEVTSQQFDTYLELVTADGTVVMENDDFEGDMGHSRIQAELEATDYYVVVTSYNQGEQGTYELVVRDSTSEGNAEQ